MRMKHMIYVLCIVTILLSILVAPGYGKKSSIVRLAYVEWSSEIASTHLVQAVIQEKMGKICHIIPMEADEMWEAVAKGTVDAMVSAWLPETQMNLYKTYKDQVDNLGPNLDNARVGLVVPNITVGRQTMGSGLRNKPYITTNSITELPEYLREFRGKIIGIDPKAGIMERTREAIKVYGLNQYRLINGSEVSMTAELSNAIRKQRWIVVTGWIPHWMFGRWNLKFLEDPKKVYGNKEHISTIARKGLQQDMPVIYRFLDRFNWNAKEMDQLMVWIKDDQGMYPYEKALRWIRYNQDQVNSWIE
ncbi:MAG: glycine betaine/proline transport system substrate-binding protein [Candidatus Magnetoglobus multicellularis str. Araruama]|uniref:Glycine betaine/proline transport system substrate-binding protein n=1 Tax=Candidatus Magnetoglobus multicellularis str. Araruama TaxID=890399 RepID=A0A1V1PE55_9BACT|nr:MAG: glycine betaine/proline transport system substrate-binding protein [Candidatus Magnetoglobus multicellularis str. Araruama]